MGDKQLVRLILSSWASNTGLPRVIEEELTLDQILDYNQQGYNVYFTPNYASARTPGKFVDGSQIDTFKYVFLDMDLKDLRYAYKEDFIKAITDTGYPPSRIVDSGGGIHAYWRVSDLDAMSYLRLSRRLMRRFETDEAVGQIFQLMRLPGTLNVKLEDNPRLCEELYSVEDTYTCEELDNHLPRISLADEAYCKQHFDKTYKIQGDIKVDMKLPLKFSQLIANNAEVKEIWLGDTDDRSKADFRLAHIMFGNGFKKDEAMSVLVNSAKAMSRAPQHQLGYAQNIVEKIWTYEIEQERGNLSLSSTVGEILKRAGDNIKGTRFPCHRYIDATAHGFRLGQVVGLVAGSGVGKTAIALNMFMGFVQNNPDYDHFFVPLEQPANEIAERWQIMCGANTHLHDRVHVISNYAEDGSFRHLSFDEIRDYILKFQEVTGKSAGCVVIDHIGALKKSGGRNGEGQDLMDICHKMKAFAVQTNTLLVMQSQAPREKAGIGDLELNKDAAYGTVFFESYCDYLITLWQPLKRCYSDDGCPTVTAFKFCKIRHKNQKKDEIQEDVCYKLYFDPDTSHLREMNQLEDESFKFFLSKATNARKSDRKTDLVPYQSIVWTKEEST